MSCSPHLIQDQCHAFMLIETLDALFNESPSRSPTIGGWSGESSRACSMLALHFLLAINGIVGYTTLEIEQSVRIGAMALLTTGLQTLLALFLS
jgi:hypothetical protein